MFHAFRTLALGAAVACLLPLSAQAALQYTATGSFSLSFKPVPVVGGGTQAGATDGVTTYLNNDAINALTSGVTASGAAVYADKTAQDAGLTYFGSNTELKLSFDTQKIRVNRLELVFFGDSSFPIFFDIDIDGDGKTDRSGQLVPLAGGAWSPPTALTQNGSELLSDDPNVSIHSLTFRDGGFIGFNELTFFRANTNGGGTVPEPAGYGLAALALLAAGAASRRRSGR